MSISPQEVGLYILTLVGPTIIGISVAGFTAHIALKRFHSEKWWEKKHKAYGELIDLLLEMKAIYWAASYHYERIDRAYKELSEIQDCSFDWSHFIELQQQLRRSFVLAPISVSEITEKHITWFFELHASSEEMIHEEGYPMQAAYSDMAVDVDNIISSIVEDAKRELKFK
jgi:hypothetical protein